MMNRYRRWGLTLLMGFVLAGCGPPPPPDISSDEAAQEVVRELEGTAEAVAADLPRTLVEQEGSPLPCNTGEGEEPGEVWSYLLTINLDAGTERTEVVREIYNYWKERHRQVKARTLNTDPGLYVVYEGGYVLQLTVDDDARQIYLIGSTPCLLPAADSAQQHSAR
jgi:hypothetical protein